MFFFLLIDDKSESALVRAFEHDHGLAGLRNKKLNFSERFFG